jgi:hypothetical protein
MPAVCHHVAFGVRPPELKSHEAKAACGLVLHRFAMRADGWITSWISDTTCPLCKTAIRNRQQRAKEYPNGRKP